MRRFKPVVLDPSPFGRRLLRILDEWGYIEWDTPDMPVIDMKAVVGFITKVTKTRILEGRLWDFIIRRGEPYLIEATQIAEAFRVELTTLAYDYPPMRKQRPKTLLEQLAEGG